MRTIIPSSPFPESSNSFNNFCRNLSPLLTSFDSPKKNTQLITPSNYIKTASLLKKDQQIPASNFKEINAFDPSIDCFDSVKPCRSYPIFFNRSFKHYFSSSKSNLSSLIQPQTIKKSRKPANSPNTLVKLAKFIDSPIEMKETSEFFPEKLAKPPLTKLVFSKKPSKNDSKTHCNCSRSQCLKLYCECLSKGNLCNSGCRCLNCLNNQRSLAYRDNILRTMKTKNIKGEKNHEEVGTGEENGAENKAKGEGCRCKRSMCKKKYCECFINGLKCTKFCRCQGCKNKEKTLLFPKKLKIEKPAVKIENEGILSSKIRNFMISFIETEEMAILKNECFTNKKVHSVQINENWLENSKEIAEINAYSRINCNLNNRNENNIIMLLNDK